MIKLLVHGVIQQKNAKLVMSIDRDKHQPPNRF